VRFTLPPDVEGALPPIETTTTGLKPPGLVLTLTPPPTLTPLLTPFFVERLSVVVVVQLPLMHVCDSVLSTLCDSEQARKTKGIRRLVNVMEKALWPCFMFIPPNLRESSA
jgi:hypothetical protein